MTISISDLPVEAGALPGLWLAQLNDPLTDSFAGMSFVAGVMAEPVDGRVLFRLVVALAVAGALRVEGDAFEVGDVSRLRPAAPVIAPEPVVVTEPAEVPDEQTSEKPRGAGRHHEQPPGQATEHEPPGQQGREKPPPEPFTGTPTTQAELDALTEDQLRSIAEQMGATDKRWKLPRIRRFVADELGIETEPHEGGHDR